MGGGLRKPAAAPASYGFSVTGATTGVGASPQEVQAALDAQLDLEEELQAQK